MKRTRDKSQESTTNNNNLIHRETRKTKPTSATRQQSDAEPDTKNVIGTRC